ncbi:MAG: Hsp20 family protein [Eubacteriales bacterium]|nr:Hsp20 family protein [Eubacteriales bacterium]MDD4323573.1 Hsp20 family protein [Eubacteriales bacterium]MDD4541086.1 Hsp20 family protein [Eubacteriales bacterium]
MFNMVPFGRRNRSLSENFNRGFDRFFEMFDSSMSTDIVDRGDYYELTCELPGLSKDDIKVAIDDNYLTIKVDRKDEREEKKSDYVLQERRSYNYSRRFDISGIDKEKIKGNYKNGVLKLELPKLEDEEEERDYLEIDFED